MSEIPVEQVDQETASFPTVAQADLLRLVLPDLLDPTHADRWNVFTAEQPELAREIRNRLTTSIADIEARKIAIDEVTFAYSALLEAAHTETVLRRQANQDNSAA